MIGKWAFIYLGPVPPPMCNIMTKHESVSVDTRILHVEGGAAPMSALCILCQGTMDIRAYIRYTFLNCTHTGLHPNENAYIHIHVCASMCFDRGPVLGVVTRQFLGWLRTKAYQYVFAV